MGNMGGMNPHTAKELGISDKDWVWVESDYGKLSEGEII